MGEDGGEEGLVLGEQNAWGVFGRGDGPGVAARGVADLSGAAAGAGKTGRRIANVGPSPGAELTSTRPPISVTRCQTVARPRF